MKRSRMTVTEMRDKLKGMGLKRRYWPYQDDETGTFLLRTNRPAKIVDGWLYGCEIDVYDNQTFRIWTPQVKKARADAKFHDLKIKLMDGECELFVPAELADIVLPQYGAKSRQELSDARRADLKANAFKNLPRKRALVVPDGVKAGHATKEA